MRVGIGGTVFELSPAPGSELTKYRKPRISAHANSSLSPELNLCRFTPAIIIDCSNALQSVLENITGEEANHRFAIHEQTLADQEAVVNMKTYYPGRTEQFDRSDVGILLCMITSMARSSCLSNL